MMNQTVFGTLGLVALAGLVAGCGAEAKLAGAPRTVAPEVSRQQAGRVLGPNITFKSVQMLLWKKDADSTRMKRVMNLSNNEIEPLNDKIYLLMLPELVLKERFKALGVDVMSVTSNGVYSLRELIDGVSESALEKLRAKLKELESQEPKDQSKIDRLMARIGRTELLLHVKTVVEKNQMLSEVDEFDRLQRELASKRAEVGVMMTEIQEHAVVLDTSPKLSFFTDANHKLQASMVGLKLSEFKDPEIAEFDVPAEFSTGSFTMGRVTYDDFGGPNTYYTFEIYSPRAAYYFKVARIKPGHYDGRIHYKGDIIRCGLEEGKVGTPVVVHVRDEYRDIVKCDVEHSQKIDYPASMRSAPVLRRGVAILADNDGKLD